MHRTALQHLSKVDKKLGRVIRKWGACTLKAEPKKPPYQALIRSVVYQQLHGKAAATILARFLALYPKGRFPKPEEILQTPLPNLRAAGLSAAKAASIRDIAQKTIEGLVPTTRAIEKLSDEEIIDRLTQIRGIGPWSVHMLLMFKLGRTDVLPTTDYGVRKGFSVTYGLSKLPSPKELEEYGKRWAPYRSIAAWYLWRALD